MVPRLTRHEDLQRLARHPLDPSLPTGLVFAGLGGPDGPDSVAPFLHNLFRDPAVLPIPAPFNRMVGWLIVRRRLEAVKQRYREIGHGGGSPQLEWAQRQCEALEERLRARGRSLRATPIMSYWHPFPGEGLAELLEGGARQILAVPAYPQFASATTGSVMGDLQRAVTRLAPGLAVYVLPEWHLLPGYVRALADRAEPVLRRWHAEGRDPAECALLGTAHSLPERFLKRGDPYLSQTRATMAALNGELASRLGADLGDWWKRLPGGSRPLLAFQSKVGPVRWIGPELTAEAERLAASGCRRLCVLPLSFTCEHIETLHELDIELREETARAGVAEFVRPPALNLDAGWLDSLAEHLDVTAFAPAAVAAGRDKETDHA